MRPRLSALLVLLPSLCLGSGYEFEGIGARQVGRAGAATADADDWTAVYWNPAALVRGAQKNGGELGAQAFGGMAFARDSNSLSNLPGVGAVFAKDRLDSGFILGAFGGLVPVGERAALGFGFYTPLLQGAEFQDVALSGAPTLDYKASAGILVWNVSGSVALSPEWSLGAGLNHLYGRIKTESSLTNLAPFGDVHSKLAGDGTALEAVFGLRWDPRRWFSAGAAIHSGADVTIKGDAEAEATVLPNERTPFTYSLRQPPTLDLGIALRPREGWTWTLDLHQTYWRRFSSGFRYARPGTLLADRSNAFQWRDTWKLRLGLRRELGPWELLGGYSFDRRALDTSSVDFSSAVDVPMHRLSAAIAKRWNRRLQTTVGAIGGAGSRREGAVRYRLSGFQLMAESRLVF